MLIGFIILDVTFATSFFVQYFYLHTYIQVPHQSAVAAELVATLRHLNPAEVDRRRQLLANHRYGDVTLRHLNPSGGRSAEAATCWTL